MTFFLANWKYFAYAAIILAVLYAGKRWLTARDERIYQEGKQAMSIELTKQKEAEWAAKEKEWQEKAKSVEAEREQLEIERAALNRTLKAGLDEIRKKLDKDWRDVASIPPDKLDGEIRFLSGQLAVVQ